ncbi:MAG TPA: glycosyltransferase family 10 [Flavisolibacter sp.]|jgi:hypothetical protein|nr:glycosyltransferase family 10 [Flavisolibacter sp.]
MNFFLLTPNVPNPFTSEKTRNILESYGCIKVSNIAESDCILAYKYPRLLPLLLRYPNKRFLVWTNEPRYDTFFKERLKLPLLPTRIEVMNVYGKGVFWNNLHFLGTYHFMQDNNLGIDINKPLEKLSIQQFTEMEKKKKIAAFFSNRLNKRNKLVKDGRNIDLNDKRCEFALRGKEANCLDIFGKDWPAGYANENSGFGFEPEGKPWWLDKLDRLKSYMFNLCPENTAYGYYTTEKIWHSIHAYSLPIYNGWNSNIYETFPQESFIDFANFEKPGELFRYISSLNSREYLERLNTCIEVYNASIEVKRKNMDNEAKEMVQHILQRMDLI